MRRRTLLIVAASLVAAIGVGIASPAQAADNDQSKRLAELKANFKSRLVDIDKAKSAEQIGENMQGLLEVVDPAKGVPASVSDLISAENADRREFYRIIAEQENTTPDVVARQNALRIYKAARPGDYLKKSDGTWGRKK